jgi:Asp-tRNA(Asn)/Glu-tRNA(Gln) amidotransferase A subunit family amidase
VSYDAMQGYDPADPVCVDRPADPVLLDKGIGGLRVALAGGYFRAGASVEALAAVDAVAAALGTSQIVTIPDAHRARSAAYIISTTEGAALHLKRLRTRPDDFDADVRDRLIAGALVPAAAVVQAQKFRRWYLDEMLKLFQHVDAILAPATPSVAPLIGQKTFVLDGQEMPLRPNIGVYTQPISFIGLPVVAVPVPTAAGLPIGVQIITAPWREDLALRIARVLEAGGVAVAPLSKLEG